MARRVTIPELSPISDINEAGALLVRQDGRDRWISYGDMVVDVQGTIKADHNNQWNAQYLDGTEVDIEAPQDGEVPVYRNQNSRFENQYLKANDIDWSEFSVNEFKFLRLDTNGNVIHDFVSVNSLVSGNSNSANQFLRVDPLSNNVVATTFDPDEFTINAQTLEGQSLANLDGRFLNATQNFSDVPNKAQARSEIGVYSTTETDNAFMKKASNLNDLASKSVAFDVIKQDATASYKGVVELSTSVEARDGIRDDVATTPKSIKDNYYTKQESDDGFLNSSNNLNDVNNKVLSRNNLDVFSKSESDQRYLTTGLNLSDLSNKTLGRANLEVYSIEDIDTLTLKKINNLSDVDNKAISRNNLDVYGKGQVYNKTESDDRYIHAIYLGTSNLNNIQKEGTYYQTANNNTSSSRNYPVNLAGSLFVQLSAGVTQQYQTYGQDRRLFIRGFYAGTWSSWKELGNTSSMAWGVQQLSAYLNRMDAPIDYSLPAGYVMTGLNSYHTNGAEDRRWRVYYRYVSVS